MHGPSTNHQRASGNRERPLLGDLWSSPRHPDDSPRGAVSFWHSPRRALPVRAVLQHAAPGRPDDDAFQHLHHPGRALWLVAAHALVRGDGQPRDAHYPPRLTTDGIFPDLAFESLG